MTSGHDAQNTGQQFVIDLLIGALNAAVIIIMVIVMMAVGGCAEPPTEDRPDWSCTEQGNRICGDPDGQHAAMAWATWDRVEGWRHIRVDGTRPFRVDYVGTATRSPLTGPDETALPTPTGWVVFRITYTD